MIFLRLRWDDDTVGSRARMRVRTRTRTKGEEREKKEISL